MDPLVEAFLLIGGLCLVGLGADVLGRRTPLPRVTLLLLCGFLAGPGGLGLLPELGDAWFTVVADVALVMVGFLLGSELTLPALREHGRRVLVLSLSVVAATVATIVGGLVLLGAGLPAALLLAAVACSTDPAASLDVVREQRAAGPFTRTVFGIVAIDDAWGLIVFGVMVAVVHALLGHATGAGALATAAWEIGGAVLIGAALGAPLAYLSGRVRPGEPTQAEALGMVFLCLGLALWAEVSLLLAAMVMGSVVGTLARHHNRPFAAIAGIEWPFLIAFFFLAGAALEPAVLVEAGLVGAGFIGLRVVGRAAGAHLGGSLVGLPPAQRAWLGVSLLPQAGVALGMALVASRRFPELDDRILTLVIAATVIFELVGPVVLRVALRRVGEAGAVPAGSAAEG